MPRRQQSSNLAKKSLSPKFWPHPTPPQGACDVSEFWEPLRWTFSQSLVSFWPPKPKIFHFIYKRDGITYGQTDRQTDRQTDGPITRCPRRTFQAGGINIQLYFHIFWDYNVHTVSGNIVHLKRLTEQNEWACHLDRPPRCRLYHYMHKFNVVSCVSYCFIPWGFFFVIFHFFRTVYFCK